MAGDGSIWLGLGGVLAAQVLATMSPGPSFVVVARKATTGSRAEGVAAALAMGIGASIWAGGAIFGLQTLLLRFTWLRLVLQLAGGAFLVYVAVMMWRHARDPLPTAETARRAKGDLLSAFWLGLATQLSNPKVMLFFSSVFVALLPVPTPEWAQGLLLALILVIETVWYIVVALAFSNPRLRACYDRAKVPVDQLTALVLIGLGAKLLQDAVLG